MGQKKAPSRPLVTIDRDNMPGPSKTLRGLELRKQRCKELQGLVVVLEQKKEDHHSVLLSDINKAGLLEYAQRLAPLSDSSEIPFQDRWLNKSDPSARKLLNDIKRWASEPAPPEDGSASPSTEPHDSKKNSNTSQEDTANAASGKKEKETNQTGSVPPTPDAACDSKEPAVVIDDSQEVVASEVKKKKIDLGINDEDIPDANVQPFGKAFTGKHGLGVLWGVSEDSRSKTHDSVKPKDKQSQHAVDHGASSIGSSSNMTYPTSASAATPTTKQGKKHSDVANDPLSPTVVRQPQSVLSQVRIRNRDASFPSTVASPAPENQVLVKASPATIGDPSVSPTKQQTQGSFFDITETGNERPIAPSVDMEAERKRLRPVIPPAGMESQRKKLDSWLRWWLERHEKQKQG